MQRAPVVRVTQYEMRVAQKRPLLSLSLTTTSEEFFFQVDIQRSLVNLTLFLTTKALDNHLHHCIAELVKKKTDITKIRNNIFLPMVLFKEVCTMLRKELPQYKELMTGIELIIKELNSRTKFLEREDIKRNHSNDQKQEDKPRSKLERFQQKFKFLLDTDYQLDTEQTFEGLYERVRREKDLPQLNNSMVQLKFSELKKRYAKQYELLSKMHGMSRATPRFLPKGLTSLYVVRTDLETTINGQTFNVVKVGKTNQSIIDYERRLYEDYKCKILFEHVYLGIFYEQQGKVIDHYFHDRLVKIPSSKYFIFNYTDFEDNLRVSQEFYLLTEEFIQSMQELLRNYCESHRQPPKSV